MAIELRPDARRHRRRLVPPILSLPPVVITVALAAWLPIATGDSWGERVVNFASGNGIASEGMIICLWLWLMTCLSIEFAVFVHELGHVVGALAARFEIQTIVSGAFLWSRTPEGAFAGLHTDNPIAPGGFVGAATSDGRRLRERAMVFVSAGPIASIILALAVSISAFAWCDRLSSITIAVIFGIGALSVVLESLLPGFTPQNGWVSDREMFLGLARRDPAMLAQWIRGVCDFATSRMVPLHEVQLTHEQCMTMVRSLPAEEQASAAAFALQRAAGSAELDAVKELLGHPEAPTWANDKARGTEWRLQATCALALLLRNDAGAKDSLDALECNLTDVANRWQRESANLAVAAVHVADGEMVYEQLKAFHVDSDPESLPHPSVRWILDQLEERHPGLLERSREGSGDGKALEQSRAA